MINIIRRALFICLLTLSSIAFGNGVEDTVASLISQKLEPYATEVELKFDSKQKFNELQKLDQKEINNVQLVNFSPAGSTFVVSVTLASGQMHELQGKYIAYTNLPVAARNLTSGTLISESDISEIKVKLSSVSANYAMSVSDVVGMQVKRILPAGAFIRKSELVKPLLVKNNDSVTLIYKSNNIKLTTSGNALESGAIGDVIKVKNSSTGVVVYGKVKAKNIVEVGE